MAAARTVARARLLVSGPGRESESTDRWTPAEPWLTVTVTVTVTSRRDGHETVTVTSPGRIPSHWQVTCA